MSGVGLTKCGREVRWEEVEGNLDSLNSTCLKVYKRLDWTSRHK